MKSILLSFSLVLLFGCYSDSKSKHSNIEVVDLEYAFNHREQIMLSEIANEIIYTPLETTKDCLLGRALRVFLNDEFIIAIAYRQIYLFDRYSGKFLFEIGKYGKEPDGYRNTIFVMPFNEKTNRIYAKGWQPNSYYEYSLSGKLENILFAPINTKSFCKINDSISISYIRNYSGKENKRLIIFDENNNFNNILFNYSTFEKTNNVVSWKGHGWFYMFDEKINFFELFNDTVYQVINQKISPKYVFHMGKYSPPYEEQSSIKFLNKKENFFFINDLIESDNLLFFSTEHKSKHLSGFYSKVNNEAFISSSEGFQNDIDGFISFIPKSISNNKFLIGFSEAYKVHQWFKDNPQKAANLPEQLQKLKNIKETDNPVVMIVKLK